MASKLVSTSLNVASTAASFGFSVAKVGTSLGFSIARGVSSTVVGLAGLATDYAVFGTNKGTSTALRGAVSSVITLAEQLALAPILLGETVTSTGLVAAQSSVDVLADMFPGSDEASFSLASFVALVRREWNDPVEASRLPEERGSVPQMARALVAWASLQSVTQEWQQGRWLQRLKEIDVADSSSSPDPNSSEDENATVRVTEDTMLPRHAGEVISADIGQAPLSRRPPWLIPVSRSVSRTSSPHRPPLLTNGELKATLRRLSKMVLGGYGGAGLIFFGVSLTPTTPTTSSSQSGEESVIQDVINASEKEATSRPPKTKVPKPPESQSFRWWDVVLGKHDKEIFEGYAFAAVGSPDGSPDPDKDAPPPTAVVSTDDSMPRYWVLTDHARKQVVLVFRGTMSINELAVDLTCEPARFRPAQTLSISVPDPEASDDTYAYPMPGSLNISPDNTLDNDNNNNLDNTGNNADNDDDNANENEKVYMVHGGMLRMARMMGGKGRPVHRAVRDALRRNDGYELILCGHSLGAGVAGLLAMTWADPETCLTVRSSGLPSRRRVSAYLFAPPCLVCADLTSICSPLITSFVYSHDVVSRLSLGAVRDMKSACLWLCEGKDDESMASITTAAMKWKAGFGGSDDMDRFISIRKTLEANMQMADLFPPGRVLWAIRNGSFHPTFRAPESAGSKVRLFEVADSREVFSQMIFARDMLRHVLSNMMMSYNSTYGICTPQLTSASSV